MFKKLQEKWKADWWLKEASNLAKEYVHRRDDLVKRLEEEMALVKKTYDSQMQNLKQLEAEAATLVKKEEQEIAFLEKRITDKKEELMRVNNELQTQIRMTEAKASPSHVWESAFSTGFAKAFDFLQPIMCDSLLKMKEKIHDDAITDYIKRNGNNKKTH